jgi:hypothetical protein
VQSRAINLEAMGAAKLAALDLIRNQYLYPAAMPVLLTEPMEPPNGVDDDDETHS